jgi:hypothetical protein
MNSIDSQVFARLSTTRRCPLCAGVLQLYAENQWLACLECSFATDMHLASTACYGSEVLPPVAIRDAIRRDRLEFTREAVS